MGMDDDTQQALSSTASPSARPGQGQPADLDAMLRWFALYSLQERYVAVLDNDQLEAWPELFTADCLYEIVPKENFDAGLPIGIVRCENRRMLHDRVTSLRHANIYEAHTYRHMTSGLSIQMLGDGRAAMQSSYVVVRTLQDGESEVYQAGRYLDMAVRTDDGWRYESKRVVYDTLRVHTLLATPI